MSDATPVSTLLSQVLVAFAIEFDNEFELRLSRTWARPFKTSIVMWSNFMRYVAEDGTTVGNLQARGRLAKEAIGPLVGGLERWGYLTVDAGPSRKGFGSARGVKPDTVLRPSTTGKLAQEVWAPLAVEVEDRWNDRLGKDRVEALRLALRRVEDQLGLAMPRFLPVVSARGLFADAAVDVTPGDGTPDSELPALVSRVLLALTLDVERGSDVSLPIACNALRVLHAEPEPVSDLPRAAGVSKEAVSVSMTWLEREGYIAVAPNPAGRGKVAALTDKGAAAQVAVQRRLADVEREWGDRFGKDAVEALRGALQFIVDQPGGEDGPLSTGLVPNPGGWRGAGRYKPLTAAFIESPKDALPHHPMVTHRGGWPDGS